ncbi:MAG: septum formation initiator family protein [Clostridia bacterium]
MKKNKKIYRNILILIIGAYVILTLFNQQKILNQYTQDNKDLAQKIEQEKETKEELAKKKEDVNSLDFIEQTAREKLDMYYPNERVYI